MGVAEQDIERCIGKYFQTSKVLWEIQVCKWQNLCKLCWQVAEEWNHCCMHTRFVMNVYQFAFVVSKKLLLYSVFNGMRHHIESKMREKHLSKCWIQKPRLFYSKTYQSNVFLLVHQRTQKGRYYWTRNTKILVPSPVIQEKDEEAQAIRQLLANNPLPHEDELIKIPIEGS